jgi:hypothetical protein
MKRITSYLVIGATLALAAGCALPGSPDYDTAEGAMVALDADEVSQGLKRCACRFGARADWPTPDAVYTVTGRPGVVVLVHDGHLSCQTSVDVFEGNIPANPLRDRVPGDQASASSPTDDSNPLPADGVNTSNDKASDSNPLPAKGGGTVTTTDERSDSNPLPAHGGGGGTVSTTDPIDDSNPLPADEDSRGDFPEQQLEGLSTLI